MFTAAESGLAVTWLTLFFYDFYDFRGFHYVIFVIYGFVSISWLLRFDVSCEHVLILGTAKSTEHIAGLQNVVVRIL